MEKYLNQVSCIENTEENGVFFDELVKDIKTGNACCAVKKLVTLPNSDRDLLTYENILDSARTLDERIVYDDMFYVLTASKGIMTLYEYCNVTDMLGDTLEEGEEVLWADPDDSARDLNVTWKVRDLISSELVSIITSNEKDGFNIVKVKPSELVKKSSIIHVEYDAGCGSMG